MMTIKPQVAQENIEKLPEKPLWTPSLDRASKT